jgi:hypothetical protein
MKTQKGKLDLSKQNKAQNYVDGWSTTSQRLRSIAIIVLLSVIGFTIFASFVSPYKYFPSQPSYQALSHARLIAAVKNFKPPPQ